MLVRESRKEDDVHNLSAEFWLRHPLSSTLNQ